MARVTETAAVGATRGVAGGATSIITRRVEYRTLTTACACVRSGSFRTSHGARATMRRKVQQKIAKSDGRAREKAENDPFAAFHAQVSARDPSEEGQTRLKHLATTTVEIRLDRTIRGAPAGAAMRESKVGCSLPIDRPQSGWPEARENAGSTTIRNSRNNARNSAIARMSHHLRSTRQ